MRLRANYRREKEGALAWDREPQRSRSLIRSRRGRIMGSSILASLSEAGGNDPFLPVSGPLPPHELVDADRVGTRPTHGHMQVRCPNFRAAGARQMSIFNELADGSKMALGWSEPVRDEFGACVPNRLWPLRRLRTMRCLGYSLSYSLFGSRACCIMEVHLRLE